VHACVQGSSGAGPSGANRQNNNQEGGDTVQVFGSDMYTVAFMLVLMLMGLLKVRCALHVL
jgi:hypothetical protein